MAYYGGCREEKKVCECDIAFRELFEGLLQPRFSYLM